VETVEYAQIVRRLVCLLALLLGVSASEARGRAGVFTLRLYDPTGKVPTQVTQADVIRPSAWASEQPDGTWYLYFRLTNRGNARFATLTRALARRGARLHTWQRFAFEIDGRVYLRPFVDYKAFPNGLDSSEGFEFPFSYELAHRLAKAIRGG
jgi:hypothetical protein